MNNATCFQSYQFNAAYDITWNLEGIQHTFPIKLCYERIATHVQINFDLNV